MKKFIGVMIAAGGAFAGVAHAEASFTGNIGAATDYTFRGVSQTQEGPAVQGGLDFSTEVGSMGVYAGAWASNVDFGLRDGSAEIDLYAGVRPKINDMIALDLGVIGYAYPNASDDGAELDYIEGYAKVGVTPVAGLTLGGAVFVSPEFTGETGTGVYGEVSAAYQIMPLVAVSGAYGVQKAEDADFDPSARTEDSYQTWNAGVTLTPQADLFKGFSLDLRYVGTDIDDLNIAEDRAVFAIKRTM